MKIIRFIYILIAVSAASYVHAQEVLYTAFEKFDFRSGDFSVIGKVGSRLYTYRATDGSYYLDAYNDAMEKQATVVLDFFPSKIYETRFIAYTDKIIVLYQALQDNRVVQYAALLDATGRLVKDPIVFNSAKYGILGPNRDYFSSAVSDDKKHIFIYAISKKGKDLTVDGEWMTDALEISHQSSATFSVENDLAYGEAVIHNDGTLYLPVYAPIGSKNYADQLWLLALPPGERKFARYEVPLNNKYAAGTYMKLDNINNRMYVAGFYSEKKNGNYEGVLYTYLDLATHTFENRKNIAFDDRLRNSTGERNLKRAMNDFQVRQIIVKNDGGLVLIAEDFYITTRNGNTPGFGYYSWYYPAMSASVREYHYGDVLAMSYNSEGVREWYDFIRKNQYSQEDGGVFSSYLLLNTGGTLGFLYNDFRTSRSRVQLASIDGDGKMNIHSLAAEKNDDPDWLPRSGKQVSAREVVVPCLRKKQLGFSKVIF